MLNKHLELSQDRQIILTSLIYCQLNKDNSKIFVDLNAKGHKAKNYSMKVLLRYNDANVLTYTSYSARKKIEAIRRSHLHVLRFPANARNKNRIENITFKYGSYHKLNRYLINSINFGKHYPSGTSLLLQGSTKMDTRLCLNIKIQQILQICKE